mgnify:CR=1 FL=1
MKQFIKKHKKWIIGALIALLSGGSITIGVNADGLFINYEQVTDESGKPITGKDGERLDFTK